MAFISVVASALFPLFPSLFSPVADSAEREGMRIRKKEQFCVLCCLSLSLALFFVLIRLPRRPFCTCVWPRCRLAPNLARIEAHPLLPP